MISREELTRLAGLQSEHGILSAYLHVNPRLMYDRGHPLAGFKDAVKRLRRRTREDRWLAAIDREKGAVERFLEGWQPRGRGLAIFSCQPAGIWEVVNLDVAVPGFADMNSTTHTAILAQVLDEYPLYVVALVQEDRASIFVSEQRVVEEEAEIASEVPGRHDQGGWAQARFQRHIQFHVTQHLKKVVEELERLHRSTPFKRLAVGGSEPAASELLKMLPRALSDRVIGTFPVDFKHETETEVLRRARALWREDERRSEREQVSGVIDAAESGGQGAVGMEETLRAVSEGRVHTLIVAEGVTREGSVCPQCGYLAAAEPASCPACAVAMEAAPDVVERAVERVYLGGGHVETVFEEAREWLLARGGLGAVLRY